MQFDILNSSSTLIQPHHIIIIHTDFRLDSPPMMMTPQETSIHHIRECIRRTQILHKYSHTLWIVSGFSASITHMDYGYGWQGALVVCQRLVFLLADGSMAMLLNVKQEKKTNKNLVDRKQNMPSEQFRIVSIIILAHSPSHSINELFRRRKRRKKHVERQFLESKFIAFHRMSKFCCKSTKLLRGFKTKRPNGQTVTREKEKTISLVIIVFFCEASLQYNHLFYMLTVYMFSTSSGFPIY